MGVGPAAGVVTPFSEVPFRPPQLPYAVIVHVKFWVLETMPSLTVMVTSVVPVKPAAGVRVNTLPAQLAVPAGGFSGVTVPEPEAVVLN